MEGTFNENLETKVALNCSIIGIGNAGNQLLNVAAREGIDVFAINSSISDLNNAVVRSDIKSFVIGDEARGAGKNRDVAKSLLKINGKKLMTEIPAFTEMCERSDVIFVAGSTAGGTGSGIAPAIIELLKIKYPKKIVSYIGIIPRLTDSVKAQANSIACLAEIQKLKISYQLSDLQFYKDASNDEAYTKTLERLTDCVNVFRGKYLNKSSFGMIDENDMRTILAEPGYISIYNLMGITQLQLDSETMQSRLIKLIKNSPAVEITRDGIVKQMGIILNVPEDMVDSSKSGDYEELIKYIGRPQATFENYSITDDATGQMLVILSGQTDPVNRVRQMADIVRASEEKLSKQKSYDFNELIGDSALNQKNIPSFLATERKSDDESDSAIDDFFSNIL